MDSIQLQTKELLTYHCGCHGNLVTVATRYVAVANRPIEPPYQIWTQYDSRQRSESKMYLTQTDYPVSRVGLQQSLSSTFPTFYISISRSSKPALPGIDTSFEVPRPESWTGFQTSSAL